LTANTKQNKGLHSSFTTTCHLLMTCINKGTPVLSLLSSAIGIGVAVAWACTRSETYSWALQDVLGIAILVTMVRVVTIPNLKLATALLACLLLYDVFFVFVTPYITPDGRSVMVNAATGEWLQLCLRLHVAHFEVDVKACCI
jgi:hypothetical protein